MLITRMPCRQVIDLSDDCVFNTIFRLLMMEKHKKNCTVQPEIYQQIKYLNYILTKDKTYMFKVSKANMYHKFYE